RSRIRVACVLTQILIPAVLSQPDMVFADEAPPAMQTLAQEAVPKKTLARKRKKRRKKPSALFSLPKLTPAIQSELGYEWSWSADEKATLSDKPIFKQELEMVTDSGQTLLTSSYRLSGDSAKHWPRGTYQAALTSLYMEASGNNVRGVIGLQEV